MFERAINRFGTTSVILNVVLNAGSSQQGKQRRASVASNCVTAANFSSFSGVIYLELKSNSSFIMQNIYIFYLLAPIKTSHFIV